MKASDIHTGHYIRVDGVFYKVIQRAPDGKDHDTGAAVVNLQAQTLAKSVHQLQLPVDSLVDCINERS